MVEATKIQNPGTAAKSNDVPKKDKKPRKKADRSNPPIYILLGREADGAAEETIQTFPSIGKARRWAESSRQLLSRLYKGLRIVRCKEVPLSA